MYSRLMYILNKFDELIEFLSNSKIGEHHKHHQSNVNPWQFHP
jgi:hypothetical protein